MEEKKEWIIAQEKISEFVKKLGFEVWKEKRINNNRIDILAKKVDGNKITYIIFEIKHYLNVSGNDERNFYDQLQKYVKEFILREIKRKSSKKVLSDYLFIGYLVLTNDFGLFKNRKKNWKKNNYQEENEIFKKIWSEKVVFFYSTPEYIKENIENLGLSLNKQTSLEDFVNVNNK